MVAYARALQHWAEKIDLPAGGRPCLLAKSMKELREEIKYYLSFSKEEVFQRVALPKEDNQSPETAPADIPKTPCAPEPAAEKRSKVLGVGKNPASLMTSGDCWGDLPPIKGPDAKRRTNLVPPG